MNATPLHLRPESCHICGHSEHGDEPQKYGHKFWSNADAKAEFDS